MKQSVWDIKRGVQMNLSSQGAKGLLFLAAKLQTQDLGQQHPKIQISIQLNKQLINTPKTNQTFKLINKLKHSIQIPTKYPLQILQKHSFTQQTMNTYQEGYKRKFFVKSGTFQHAFCIFIWYLILALPFYFSFGGEKFWQKPKNQMLACQYNFTGYHAVQVSYMANNLQIVEDSSNIIGSTMGGVAGLSAISVSDDKSETLIKFSLSEYDAKEVQNVNVILYFKVWIEELEKEISASYVETFNGDLAYAESVAILRYEPQTELNAIDNRKVLNSPAYLPDMKPPSSFDALIDHIVENHEVHRLNHESMQTTVSSQSTFTRQFKIKLIKDTKVNIPYFPSVLETLKFAFSKWLAFVIIAYFVFYKLVEKLVKDGGLVTKVKTEIIN